MIAKIHRFALDSKLAASERYLGAGIFKGHGPTQIKSVYNYINFPAIGIMATYPAATDGMIAIINTQGIAVHVVYKVYILFLIKKAFDALVFSFLDQFHHVVQVACQVVSLE
jgi:hypothetical protein